MKNIDTSLE